MDPPAVSFGASESLLSWRAGFLGDAAVGVVRACSTSWSLDSTTCMRGWTF